MVAKPPFPDVHRIIADSDLDGMCAAVVLKKVYPDAEVHFAHAALIRSGVIDDLIDEHTVTVDLPFHPKSGWYLDHHLTNKPSDSEHNEFTSKGGIVHWDHTPSAARLAFDLFREEFNFPHLEAIMPLVDDLDSGGISLEIFLEDGPLLQLSRTLNYNDAAYMHHLLTLFQTCTSMDQIYADETVRERMIKAQTSRKDLMKLVKQKTTIIDRLAICRLEDTGHRSNGYLITAFAGEDADACCIIHGYSDGEIGNKLRPPLSASFYANSFLSEGQNRYDLSRLATEFDPHGGGHVNACGCRIQPPGLDANLARWVAMWNDRDIQLKPHD
jgi:oligoribonuclease NrnB/cAMP/cGMP phosphodiesterase (DHH superfamily)